MQVFILVFGSQTSYANIRELIIASNVRVVQVLLYKLIMTFNCTKNYFFFKLIEF